MKTSLMEKTTFERSLLNELFWRKNFVATNQCDQIRFIFCYFGYFLNLIAIFLLEKVAKKIATFANWVGTSLGQKNRKNLAKNSPIHLVTLQLRFLGTQTPEKCCWAVTTAIKIKNIFFLSFIIKRYGN